MTPSSALGHGEAAHGCNGVKDGILLGFDYGTKRMGVAVGQAVTGSARPLETVRVKNGTPDWITISRLIHTWEPFALVVGLPLEVDGAEWEMTQAVQRFSRQLHGRYLLPVHLMDERLSSRAAKTLLHEQGKAFDEVDPVAAQLILESWMTEALRP